jgi:hypothetical protein
MAQPVSSPMATATATAMATAEPWQQRNNNSNSNSNKSNRRSGRLLFYTIILFAAGWLQLSVNCFVYFWRNNNDSHTSTIARFGRFPASPKNTPLMKRESESEHKNKNGNDNNNDNRNGNANSNLRSGKGVDSRQEEEEVSLSSIEAQLLYLREQLEGVKKNLEDEIRTNEESSLFSGFSGSSSANANQQQKRKMIFVPFTIRDAQRTVPVQIPHGFEVFDFIDLFATNGDQNQTKMLAAASTENIETEDYYYAHVATRARLFHNGKPLPEAKHHEEHDCLGYSKRCYRSKLLKVIRYLLSLQTIHKGDNGNENDKNKNNTEYYYFYMEADNDLCVPLSEIRDLAFKYQRYFVATGIGASGWIMSHSFLEDFYLFWSNMDTIDDESSLHGLSEEELLEPDSVAAVLLRQTQNWSVTRRYLTSHSILAGNTNDEASIAALFEAPVANATHDGDAAAAVQKQEPPPPPPPLKTDNENANANVDDKETKHKARNLSKQKKKESPEEAALKAPLVKPSRYLPRCLEPHRGVWRDNSTNSATSTSASDFDTHHWEFFDYDLCPESDIFPCQKGQLEELTAKDPYYKTKQTAAAAAK